MILFKKNIPPKRAFLGAEGGAEILWAYNPKVTWAVSRIPLLKSKKHFVLQIRIE